MNAAAVMKIFVPVNMHVTINREDLETLLLSSFCPLIDVLRKKKKKKSVLEGLREL